MSNITIFENKSFVDYLKTKTDKDIEKYLFKIETIGNYFTTQVCKPFQESKYKKIAFLGQFVEWLKLQPHIFAREGYCETITEIWYRQDVGKLKDREIKQPKYILIWSKEKGWLGKQHFVNIYEENKNE